MKSCVALAHLVGGLLLLPVAHPQVKAEPFQYPIDAVATEDGTVYVADLNLPGIWRVRDGQAEVFVQGSPQFRTPLNRIRCLAIGADGLLLAGDSATREIYRVSTEGELTPLTGGKVGIPMCLAVDSAGRIYVSDLELQRIWRIPAEGGEPEEFAALAAVRGLAFDDEGILWAARGLAPCLVKFDADGQPVPVLKDSTFAFTNQLAIGRDGMAYVADGYGRTIWRVTAGGEATPWVQGEPLVNPVGLAWKGEDLLVTDPRANALFLINGEGKLSTLFPAAQPATSE